MNWIDRINENLLKFLKITSENKIRESNLVLLSPNLVPNLNHLVITTIDEFISESFVMFGRLNDGSLVSINDSDQNWSEVCTLLEQSKRLFCPVDIAKLKILSDRLRDPIVLLNDDQK